MVRFILVKVKFNEILQISLIDLKKTTKRESVAFAIAYAYSNYLCTSVKLYLCLGYLTLGWIGYVLIEVMERRNKKLNITSNLN